MSDEFKELISEVETVRLLYSAPLTRLLVWRPTAGLIKTKEKAKEKKLAPRVQRILRVHPFRITSARVKESIR